MAAKSHDDKAMKGAVAPVIAIDPGNMSAYTMLYTASYQRFQKGDASAKPEALEAARKLMRISRLQYGGGDPRSLERAIVELAGQPIDLTIYDAKQAYAAAFDAGMYGNINGQIAGGADRLRPLRQDGAGQRGVSLLPRPHSLGGLRVGGVRPRQGDVRAGAGPLDAGGLGRAGRRSSAPPRRTPRRGRR